MQSTPLERAQALKTEHDECGRIRAMRQTCAACGAVLDPVNVEGTVKILRGAVYCHQCYAVKLVSAKLRDKLGISPELIDRLLYVKKD